MHSNHLPLRVMMISVRADHGGGPKHIELLLQNLSKKNEFFVACPDDPPYRERFERHISVPVFTIPHRQFSLSVSLKLVRYAHQQRIDIIHSHGKGAGLYARIISLLTGKPNIHTPHGIHVSRYGALTRRVYRFYENATAPWIKQIIFVSDEERKIARQEGLWPHTPKQVIVNGIDDVRNAYRDQLRIETRHSLGISEEQRLVVTISRFDFQKNMHEAYEVVRALPDYLFLWIGDGSDTIELSEKAHSEQLGNLRFLGRMDDPIPILAASDVYFSSARWEGMPLAVLEAMAVGLPVVASDVTGHREIVADSGSGLLYTLGNPTEAATCVKSILDNQQMRQNLGGNGQRAQRTCYSSRQMSEAVLNLYRQLSMGTTK